MNRNRLNSMANGLMNGFRRITNQWVGLNMIGFIAGLKDVELQVESE